MPEPSGSAARPKNVLLIVADDLGFSDLGCYGSEIRTPRLDRLAAGGTRLTHFYNCARCCPSRASLLTGLYPHQAGVGHMVRNWNVPGYEGFLNDHCVTIAEVLGEAGYATGLSGKWHVGGRYTVDRSTWTPGISGHPTPRQRGFDRYFGVMTGGGSYFQPHALMVDDEIVEDSDELFYYTDAIAQNAIRMLEEFGEAPFFLYVAFTAPHWPLHALPEDVAGYEGAYDEGWDVLRRERHKRAIAQGVVDPKWSLPVSDPMSPAWDDTPHQEWEAARMAVYAAQVDRMDQRIGDIVDALEASGRLDDTLIVFFSDNGASAEELEPGDQSMSQVPASTRDGRPIIHGNVPGVMPGAADTFMSYGLPWAQLSNTPFRRYKSWAHEGGVATPCIVHAPGLVPPGAVVHGVGHVVDLLPTLLELTGADYPASFRGHEIQPLEGVSLLPLLHGSEPWTRGPLCWEHEGKRAVRTERWKLVAMHAAPWELYDMWADRTECHDLAAVHPEVVNELAGIYQDWARRLHIADWGSIDLELRRTDAEDRAAREASAAPGR